MHLKMGWIYLRDPERKSFHLASWYGIEEEMVPVFLGILSNSPCACQENLISGELGTVVNNRVCSRLEKLTRLNIVRNHITIPMVAREQHFGLINLSCDEGVTVPDEDMELLLALGNQIAEIVANAWLQIKLTEKEAARQVLLESLVQAQEEERLRLARELHDGAGQTLTSLLVRLKTLERKSPSPEMQRDLTNMQDIVSETIKQIRELAYRLRPVALDEFGLSRALEILVEDMTNGMGITIESNFDLHDLNIPTEIEVVLYRIAQEGLTNIIRHARAGRIRLLLSAENKGVKMTLEDDGIGFDPGRISINSDQRHLGLISMRERAEIIGGMLEVYTAIGKGTTIEAFIPIL